MESGSNPAERGGIAQLQHQCLISKDFTGSIKGKSEDTGCSTQMGKCIEGKVPINVTDSAAKVSLVLSITTSCCKLLVNEMWGKKKSLVTGTVMEIRVTPGCAKSCVLLQCCFVDKKNNPADQKCLNQNGDLV